jgi:hypothetical protein
MTTTTVPAMSIRRILPAALIAATAAFGLNALADPASASALPDTPGEWDIGAYDQCVNAGENQLPDKPNAQEDHLQYCCINSGGVWNASLKKCQAPPAEPAQGPATRVPGRLPVHTLEPVENPAYPVTHVQPGTVLYTLAPAS